MIRQFKHWGQVLRGPGKFDTREVARRRPDMRAKHKEAS